MPRLNPIVAALAFMMLGATVLDAGAIERINTLKSSCGSIQRTLITEGAAVLRQPSKRKPGLTIYDRYVGDSRFCNASEIGKWASVPAKDDARCTVIACVSYEPDDLFPLTHWNHPWLRLRTGM
jgi:hypothetical protein